MKRISESWCYSVVLDHNDNMTPREREIKEEMNVKFLICDFSSSSHRNPHQTFYKMVSATPDCELVHVDSLEQHQLNVSQWETSVLEAIQGCDVLISLKKMSLLREDNPVTRRIVEAFINKIKSGAPVLLYLSEENYFASLIYQELSVQATSYATQDLHKGSNPYQLSFHKDEGALADDQIFHNVNAVFTTKSHLIKCTDDYIPVMHITKPSQYINLESDVLEDGTSESAVMVKGTQYDSLQLIFTAPLFEEPYVAVFGHSYDGIASNQTLTQNILNLLVETAKARSEA